MHYFQGSLAIKILKLKLFYLSTIPTLVLGILILIYFSSIKDFPVFPNTQTFNYRFYSDSTAGGNSKILKQVITDSIIKLDYQIGNKINSPYAGLNVGPKESKSINFGYYNELKIRLKGNEINGIGIALVTQNSLKKSDKRIFYSTIFLKFHLELTCMKLAWINLGYPTGGERITGLKMPQL